MIGAILGIHAGHARILERGFNKTAFHETLMLAFVAPEVRERQPHVPVVVLVEDELPDRRSTDAARGGDSFHAHLIPPTKPRAEYT